MGDISLNSLFESIKTLVLAHGAGMTSAAALAGISGNDQPVRSVAFAALLIFAIGLISAAFGLFFNSKQIAAMAEGMKNRLSDFLQGEAGHIWVTDGKRPDAADRWGTAFTISGWGSAIIFLIGTAYLGYALRSFWF